MITLMDGYDSRKIKFGEMVWALRENQGNG